MRTAVHDNSIAAFHAEEANLNARAAAVLRWVRLHGEATDRQVMRGMGFTEPNAVRPRITELVQAGLLAEVRNVRCPETGKTVRIVGIPRQQEELFA